MSKHLVRKGFLKFLQELTSYYLLTKKNLKKFFCSYTTNIFICFYKLKFAVDKLSATYSDVWEQLFMDGKVQFVTQSSLSLRKSNVRLS